MTTEELHKLADDRQRNPLGLTFMVLYNRVIRRGWALTKALTTPIQTNQQSGKTARRNPTWNNFHLS
jgi:hypothetical protein